MEKLIITAALLGAGTTRAQASTVPLTPDEIAQQVVAAAKAGAAIVHLHARQRFIHPSPYLRRIRPQIFRTECHVILYDG